MGKDEEVGFIMKLKGKAATVAGIKEVASATDKLTSSQKKQTQQEKIQDSQQKKRGKRKISPGLLAGAGVGGLIDVALLKNAAQTTVDFADNSSELAANFGLVTGRAQELTAAVATYGIEQSQFQMGLVGLTAAQKKGLQGDEKALSLFGNLGISMNELAATRGDVGKLFDVTLLGLEGIEDTSQRALVARQLFGRAWQGIGGIVEDGTAEFERVRQKARELGLALGPGISQSAQEAEQGMRDLQLAQLAWNIFLGETLLPILTKIMGWLTSHPDAVKNVITVYAALTLATKVLALNQIILSAAFRASPVGMVVTGIQLLIVVIAALAIRFKSVRKVFSDTWEGIKRIWNAAPGFFALIGKSIVNAYLWPWNKAIDFINSAFHFDVNIPDWVPGLPDKWTFDAPDIPNIPTLGDGGTAASAGMAIVGERGPELLSLPTGARITPSAAIIDALAPRGPAITGAGGPVIARFYLDKKMIAEAVAGAENDRRARR